MHERHSLEVVADCRVGCAPCIDLQRCCLGIGTGLGPGSERREERRQKDQKKDEKKTLELKPERKIEFSTDEGTWLSLDISPDGRTIVFELLGDIYTLPVEGGQAQLISGGMPFDSQPRLFARRKMDHLSF